MKGNNPENNTWLAIINPNAGTRKGKKDWHEIARKLQKANIDYREQFTSARGHARQLVQEYAARGFRQFLIVGGDGTLNEAANGIFQQSEIPSTEFLVGMIPVGTGNDWCRSFFVPFSYKKAVKVLKRKKIRMQDVGKITYFDSTKQESRFFVNVAGMGYDAVVASKTNRDKEKGRGGPLVYLKNLLTSLLSYKHTDTELILDGNHPVKGKSFSLSVGIGKYNGGGMKQLPDAIFDDGIFDITVIKKLSKFTVVKEVKNLFDGSFVNHPKVDTMRARSIVIKSNPEIFLEADGESLGHSPFTFEILPRSLRVVAGDPDKFTSPES